MPIKKGNYLVSVVLHFEANATGQRGFYFGTNANAEYATLSYPNSGNLRTTVQFIYMMEVEHDTNYYFIPYQNSGSTLNVDYTGVKFARL